MTYDEILILCFVLIAILIVAICWMLDVFSAWSNERSLFFRLSPSLFKHTIASTGPVGDIDVDRLKSIKSLDFQQNTNTGTIYFRQKFFLNLIFPVLFGLPLREHVMWLIPIMQNFKCTISNNHESIPAQVVIRAKLHFSACLLLFFIASGILVLCIIIAVNSGEIIRGLSLFIQFLPFILFIAVVFVAVSYLQFKTYARWVEAIIHSVKAPTDVESEKGQDEIQEIIFCSIFIIMFVLAAVLSITGRIVLADTKFSTFIILSLIMFILAEVISYPIFVFVKNRLAKKK